jgi:hypothetical protein
LALSGARQITAGALGVKRIPLVIEFFQSTLRSIEAMGDLVFQQNEKPSAGVIGFLATIQGLQKFDLGCLGSVEQSFAPTVARFR